MLKKIATGFLASTILFSCDTTPQLGKASIDEVLTAMTLEEKATIAVGTGMAGFSGDSTVVGETSLIVPGAAGTTHPIKRLGIPAVVLADGPAGLRISPTRENDDKTYYATAFPVGTLLASTWNTELVEEVGKAMGNEVLEYGVDILLAPALNIHRNPLCGRNFEYYSEDPLVSGKIAAAMVRGVQSNGVGTSIKHFAVNNQETNRMANNAQLTTRALREIYLKGFEIAVKESEPWTVMSSYNFINGTYAAENYDLLTTILRNEWKYKGIVMTDWFGGSNPSAMIHAGNDLLMPGMPKQKDDIIKAVKDGSLKMEDLDLVVKRILSLIVETPRFKGYKYSNQPNLSAHAATTRQSATEGMVLLKNENNALPLTEGVKTIAAFGVTSYDFINGGTGSGDVNSAYSVSLGEGLKNAGYTVNEALKAEYEKAISSYKAEVEAKGGTQPFMPEVRMDEFIPGKELLQEALTADVALITIGRTSGEFMDRKLERDFELSANEKQLIEQVTKAFRSKGKRTIVVMNIGGVVETNSWKNIPDAILVAWQAGQEGGNSVVDILSGKVNPSGKLPMTFPVNYFDSPSSNNFPHNFKFEGNILENMMNRDKKSVIKDVDYTVYEEDIFVGYRYFDTFSKLVSYPFGYGLSYTSFDYSNLTITEQKDIYVVSVDVKNTGKISGKEVIQLYVSAPKGKLPKPEKELKAFSKTKELKSGEQQTLKLNFSKADLASFDSQLSEWILEQGEYTISVGSSSQDIKANLKISIGNIQNKQVNNVLTPQNSINVLK